MESQKKNIGIIIISIILSSSITILLINTVPTLRENLRGPMGEQGPIGERGPMGEQGLSGTSNVNDSTLFTFSVNVGFSFGNGTTNWYNNTRINPGDTIIDATLQAIHLNNLLIDYKFDLYDSFPRINIISYNGIKEENSETPLVEGYQGYYLYALDIDGNHEQNFMNHTSWYAVEPQKANFYWYNLWYGINIPVKNGSEILWQYAWEL